MLYYENLEEKIFDKESLEKADQLNIISGYVGCEPIRRLKEIPSNVHAVVIYGMFGSDNISAPLHNALVKLQKQMPNVEILYSTEPIHSKIYLWGKDGKTNNILVGSANFSVSGLRNDYKEVLIDAEESSYEEFLSYLKYVKERCIPCTDVSIKPRVMSKIARSITQKHPLLIHNICRATLLDNDGRVPGKSGLNWGFSKGHVTEGDAYIPIRMEYIHLFPTMFQPKKYLNGIGNENTVGRKNRENDEVELIWDDGTIMLGLLEGKIFNSKDGKWYPKQLSSSPQKSIIGKYIRNRIGVSSDKVITKTDLVKYGRTHIDISLISEGIYYMDFSVSKSK